MNLRYMSLFGESILHFDEWELRIMFSDVPTTSSITTVTPASPGKTYCIMLQDRNVAFIASFIQRIYTSSYIKCNDNQNLRHKYNKKRRKVFDVDNTLWDTSYR